MLSVMYAECHMKALYAECRNAECHPSECHYAQGGATLLNFRQHPEMLWHFLLKPLKPQMFNFHLILSQLFQKLFVRSFK